jgi:hypothetical protein
VSELAPAGYVEQYLLFDNTEYIQGIGHIGQVALIELIGEQDETSTDGCLEQPMLELLPPQVADLDNGPRLFEC